MLLKSMVWLSITSTDLGYVYRMSPGYTTHLLDLIITTAIADSLPLNNLTLDQIQNSISSDEEKPECIEAVLKSFSEDAFERNHLPKHYLSQPTLSAAKK